MGGENSGQVITFYSYKGGTGRSMALANIACLLAQRQALAEGKGVLVIDWDLEAPGLHRYFRDKFRNVFASRVDGASTISDPPVVYDQKLELHRGLIDLFVELDRATRPLAPPAAGETHQEGVEPQDEDEARAIIEKINPEQYVLKTDVPSLYMMKAGSFDDGYAARVSMFQWEALYNRSPWLIRSLAEYLSERYQYVLIDSRTGITDISGICTMLLPEKLVVVFTPNRQSLLGVQELVRRATRYRRQSDDLRPLAIFPLPSRIEASEPTLLDQWRLGDEKADIPGYQPLFEKLFEEVYDLASCDLTKYFSAVQLQHAPSYSYGEKVAVLLEKSESRLSLPQSYETVVEWLANQSVPWEQQQQPVAEQDAFTEQIKLAEATYARLSVEQQEATRRLFTRLVRLARPEEGGEDTRQRAKFSELDKAERQVAEAWARPRLVVIQQDEGNSDTTVEPASESLIREWKRLRAWLDEDRDFLLWRQSLRADILKWKNAGREKSALLTGRSLIEAERRMDKHYKALNSAERSFIWDSSWQQFRRRDTIRSAAITTFALLLIVSIPGILFWKQQRQVAANNQVASDLLTKGQAYKDAGEYTSAIKAFDEAIQRKPDLAEAYYERGRSYDNLGDREHAISDYDQAIKLKPDYAEAYLKRGDAYYYENDRLFAISDYTRTIALLPDSAEAYFARGRANIGYDFTSAIADLNRAINLRPNYVDALYQRGYAYKMINEIDAAISDLRQVRDLNTDPVLTDRADLLLKDLEATKKAAASPSPSPSAPGADQTPLTATSLEDLVKQMMFSENADIRHQAVSALLSRYSSSSQAISLTLNAYSEGRIANLSPAAIVNGFYFLNRTTPSAWSSQQIGVGSQAAARAEGLGVGPEASGEITAFKAFLLKLSLGRIGGQRKK